MIPPDIVLLPKAQNRALQNDKFDVHKIFYKQMKTIHHRLNGLLMVRCQKNKSLGQIHAISAIELDTMIGIGNQRTHLRGIVRAI